MVAVGDDGLRVPGPGGWVEGGREEFGQCEDSFDGRRCVNHIPEAATCEFRVEEDVLKAEVAEDEVEELGGVEHLRGHWCCVAGAHEDGEACCARSACGVGGGHVALRYASGSGCELCDGPYVAMLCQIHDNFWC